MQPNYYPPPGGYGPPPGGGGYGPPPGPPPGFPPAGPPGGGASAQGQVAVPAIGLIVISIIAILWMLFSLVMNLLFGGLGFLGAASGSSDGVGALFSGVIGIIATVIWLLLWAVVLFGAIKMKSVQSYGLAMASAVIAAIPCTSGFPCCFLGTPLGIWAIVVLMNQQVKASFR